jgi:hypothetical protein
LFGYLFMVVVACFLFLNAATVGLALALGEREVEELGLLDGG